VDVRCWRKTEMALSARVYFRFNSFIIRMKPHDLAACSHP